LEQPHLFEELEIENYSQEVIARLIKIIDKEG
jgi:5'(3')-deoxyribonucleotidase